MPRTGILLASLATLGLLSAVSPASADPFGLGAVSNCGGVAPLKNACAGAGVLDNQWRTEIRSAGAFAGTVRAELHTATGFSAVECDLPTPTADGVCTSVSAGLVLPGQSFVLEGSVRPLAGAPSAAGHWLISVYTSP